MTQEQLEKAIETLRDDNQYFGDFGKQFFSNSEIGQLINQPDQYGEPWKKSVDFEKGQYLHKRMLEPWLFEDDGQPMVIVNCSTRNNKEYKELVAANTDEDGNKPIYLLQKEADEMDYLVKMMERNDEFVEVLRGDLQDNEVEEPMIKEIEGYLFKGKADRKNQSKGIVADLKSTRGLDSFRMNFKKYGYHSQAYIYRELFGLNVRFYVIDKETGRLGIYDVCDETLELGRKRVLLGLEKYETYYGENPTMNVDQYVDYDVL